MKPAKVTKGFLVDIVTQESLKFQYNPNEITLTRTPNWASTEIPGMSFNQLQWISGGERKFSFKLDFFFDSSDRYSIAKKLDWIESLTFPDYSGTTNFKRGAHPILFNFGELYKNVRCVVTSFEAKPFYMFDPKSLLPLRAEVNLQLSEQHYSDSQGFHSVSYREVRNRHFTDKSGKVNL
jgi:hypothetical protein